MMTDWPQALQQLRSDKDEYFHMGNSVDCVIFGFDQAGLKVLLIKTGIATFQGQWSLLGDLVKTDEDLETASYRVLKERTGLENVYLEQVHTFSNVDRNPVGRVITTAYYALINIRDHQLKLSHDELHWHPVTNITTLAFDHKKILDTCLGRLRSRIDTEPLVFKLLPEKFSLRDLQSLYESIIGKTLDRRNFRKKLLLTKWLVDVNEVEAAVSHRPGKLYRFNTGLFSQ